MFIVIEGIDGTGKSTLARSLAHALSEELGPNQVVLTREPTDTSPWGRRLRRAASEGRLKREEEIDHFHRDRLHHLEKLIRPALAAGKVVVSDRYVNSMLAYQTESVEAAEKLYAQLAPELVVPDLIFVLDLSVEEALKRIGKNRNGKSQFEMKETLERARAIYASRKGAHYHRLDASQTPRSVCETALAIVKAKRAP